MLSKTSVSALVIGAAVAGVGYCIYFDRKRRSDPTYKHKIRERRRNVRNSPNSTGGTTLTEFPDLNNQEACQAFFMQEVQLGEELLSSGNFEEGVDHLANAVVICGQPQQLLQVFRQTLPPPVVQLLILKIPEVQRKLKQVPQATAATKPMPPTGPKITLVEDDVE